MVKLFDGVINLIMKPFEKLLELYEPFWEWLVKHDKWVYSFLLILLIIGTLF